MIKFICSKYYSAFTTIVNYVFPNITLPNLPWVKKTVNKIELIKAVDGLVIIINNEMVVIDHDFKVVMSSPKINLTIKE